MNVTAPVFTHDCKTCQFLGHATIDNVDYDFYVCGDESKPTTLNFLARFGNDGPDYTSNLGGYICPLSPTAMLGLALYAQHIGATGCNGFYRGTLSVNGQVAFSLK